MLAVYKPNSASFQFLSWKEKVTSQAELKNFQLWLEPNLTLQVKLLFWIEIVMSSISIFDKTIDGKKSLFFNDKEILLVSFYDIIMKLSDLVN